MHCCSRPLRFFSRHALFLLLFALSLVVCQIADCVLKAALKANQLRLPIACLGCSPLSALSTPSLTYLCQPVALCPESISCHCVPLIMQSVELSTSGSTGPASLNFWGLLTTRQLGLEARWLVGRPFYPFTRSPTQTQPGNCLHCRLQH